MPFHTFHCRSNTNSDWLLTLFIDACDRLLGSLTACGTLEQLLALCEQSRLDRADGPLTSANSESFVSVREVTSGDGLCSVAVFDQSPYLSAADVAVLRPVAWVQFSRTKKTVNIDLGRQVIGLCRVFAGVLCLTNDRIGM